MKALGYCRVSSSEQVNGTSLESQRESIESYCKMRGIELVKVLVDGGVSGGKSLSVRPAGREMIDILTGGRADSVVITKLDRGFRSASDCLINVEAWEKAGIALHILNLGGQTIDTGTPTGKFFITIMAGAAELERNLIKERCNEGRRARRAEGKRIGELPFGYSLSDDGKTLVECREEQEVINIVERLAGEGYSASAIANDLNRRRMPTKKGGTWSHKQIIRILKRAA
jgi:site-specific DNA recombinase